MACGYRAYSCARTWRLQGVHTRVRETFKVVLARRLACDVALSSHREFVQLIVDHLPQRTGSDSLTIASGIVSTLVGATMLANALQTRRLPDRSWPVQERLYGSFRVGKHDYIAVCEYLVRCCMAEKILDAAPASWHGKPRATTIRRYC